MKKVLGMLLITLVMSTGALASDLQLLFPTETYNAEDGQPSDMCNATMVADYSCWLVGSHGGTPENPAWIVWWVGGGHSCPGGFWGFVNTVNGLVYSDFTEAEERAICRSETTRMEFKELQSGAVLRILGANGRLLGKTVLK